MLDPGPLRDMPAKWRGEAHTQDCYLETKMTGQLRRAADELELGLAALVELRDFAWSKVMNWEGFNNPTEVSAHTDIIQIWQKLQAMFPDDGDDQARDRRAELVTLVSER